MIEEPEILFLLVNTSSHPANISIAPQSSDNRQVTIFNLCWTAMYRINIIVSAHTIANVRSSLAITSFTLTTFASSIRNQNKTPLQLFFTRSTPFTITTKASIVITTAYISSLPEPNNPQCPPSSSPLSVCIENVTLAQQMAAYRSVSTNNAAASLNFFLSVKSDPQ